MSPVPMASALAFTTHTMMDKADLQRFPVLRLEENIKLDLRKYASAKIRESVESTLENEILYTDLDGIIDKTAYISVIKYMPDTNERICQTTISVAYLQYLWIICDIAIRTYDRVMATTEYDKTGVDIQEFSAATGILATAFSFLFIWPSLQNDAHDPHERDDDRIFTLLDHIRNTPAWNPKFESMTVYLFNLWARQNNIPGYPFPDWESPTALSDIQLFLATYNR